MRRLLSWLAAVLLAVPVARAQPAPPLPDFHARYLELASQRGLADSARLQRLLAIDWENINVEWPEFASHSGYPGQDDRWSDVSVEAILRRRQQVLDRRSVLSGIDPARLNPADRLSYEVFLYGVTEAIESSRFPSELLQVTQRDGPQYLASTLGSMRAGTVKEYENILLRLARIPTVIEQTRALLDSGLGRGVTPPRVTLREVPAQIEQLTPDDAMASALLEPFTRFPAAIAEDDRRRLRAAAVREYQANVRPAYRRLHAYLVSRYIPGARETLARRALPDGAAWYAFDVKQQTSLSRSPAAVHDIGLAEVKRIRAQMDSLIRASGHSGDFAGFITRLRTDPRFFHADSASLVRAYRDIAKRIDPGLPLLFSRLPRLPYGVSTVPSYAAPAQATAYYQHGSPAAARAGQFFVNTYDLKTRPIWEMEALALHEAVPGHHLQAALAQEIEGIPLFRRYGTGYTAFTEGWALYAESLGGQLGLYEDSYSRFGQLANEMWRAIRLVLDTGIHTMGWTREQAIEYFRANSAKSLQEIVSEVDRYVVWPGQALAYKSGELEIKGLRAHAQRELGDQFDLRQFHDAVLSQGALPLDILRERTHAWVATRKRTAVR